MKVVHINTHSKGGAAAAAIRLHEGMVKQGIDSRMLFLHNSQEGERYGGYSLPLPSLAQRIMRRLTGYKSIEEKMRLEIIGKPRNYEVISFPVTSNRVQHHPWVMEADIVHLHWVGNFIDYPSFFKEIKKPVVWTLHDMNPIQGIFHYEKDRSSNEDGFGQWEMAMAEIKTEALSSKDNLTVVTPSAWLGQFSETSRVLGRFPHRVIPYGLDTDLFKPYSQKLARQVFGLPENKLILLFVSENMDNRRKGLDLLLDGMGEMHLDDSILICTAGKQGKPLPIKNMVNLGALKDERLMALLYSAADAFILPSREDNLPNTMLEAMACGTPVISFAVGGMKEVIIPGLNGLLAPQISADALKKTIYEFLEHPGVFNRDQIRNFAVEKFSLSHQSSRYRDLYREILNNGSRL